MSITVLLSSSIETYPELGSCLTCSSPAEPVQETLFLPDSAEVGELACALNRMMEGIRECEGDYEFAKDSLREVEIRLRANVAGSQDGALSTDAKAAVLSGSSSHPSSSEYSGEERAGKHGLEMVHPEDLTVVRLNYPIPVEKIQYRIRHRDGTWRWVDTLSITRWTTRMAIRWS